MVSPRVVIESLAHDSHAHAVAWALQSMDVICSHVFADNFPSRSTIGVALDGAGRTSADYRGPEGCFRLSEEDTFAYWSRRLSGPVMADTVAPEDESAAISENRATLRGFRRVLNSMPGATFVNDLEAKSSADHKPLQLAAAASVGLAIPRTLFSNDKDAVLAFGENEGGEVIFKTNTPMLWRRKTERGFTTVMTYSSLVTTDDLRANALLQACGAIYQQPLKKQYEVRVTVIGSDCYASKLHSQDRQDTSIDWRLGQRHMQNEPMDLPADISRKCVAFLRRMNLLIGCFDFVVTPNDDWYFLECNEQGQWLWQEAQCPEIHLLDAFSQFIREPSAGFVRSSDGGFRLADYMRTQWIKDLERAKSTSVINQGAHLRPERTAA